MTLRDGSQPGHPRFLNEKLKAIESFQRFCSQDGEPSHPLEVFFEISNICNIKCAMCGEFSLLNPNRQNIIKATKRGFIETGSIIGSFNELLKHAVQVHCFGYGEPTLHPDFQELVRSISQFEVLIDFITNGVTLDADMAAFLVDTGVYKVTFSFSGLTPDVYEAFYHGAKFDQVMSNIRGLSDARQKAGSKFPIIEINSLALRQHVDQFPSFVAMMAEAGANVIHLKDLGVHPHLPQIHEHLSIMRPWEEGKRIEEAVSLGRKLGVEVSADQFVRHGVSDQDQYDDRLEQLKADVAAGLPNQGFGQHPIEKFAQIAATVTPAEIKTTPRQPLTALKPGESREVVRELLQIGRPDMEEAEPFYCMEPFKTLYVTRNGGVKPCCFSKTKTLLLGDVASSDPVSIWSGSGYREVRQGILNGEYPKDLCGFCLKHKIAPADHGVGGLLRNYLDWVRDRFRQTDKQALTTLAAAINDIVSYPSDRIVAARRQREIVPILPANHSPWTNLQGCLDQTGTDLQGWVWCPDRPQKRLEIIAWKQEAAIARSRANILRQDLIGAGKGDGRYGFQLLLPLTDQEDGTEITLTVGSSGFLRRFPPEPSLNLQFHIDSLQTGRTWSIQGWAFDPAGDLQSLDLQIGAASPIPARRGLQRLDVAQHHGGWPFSSRSGFVAGGAWKSGELRLIARLADGRQFSELLGRFDEDHGFTPATPHFSGRVLHSAPPPALDFTHLGNILRLLAPAPRPLPKLEVPVLVVVPVYGGLVHLSPLFASLLAESDPLRRVVVVDDGNRDPAVLEILAGLEGRNGVTVIRQPANAGFVEAIWAGFRQRRPDEHLVILNTDTILPPGWLARLVRPFQDDPTIASATPFSNAASICGFPHMPEDNPIPLPEEALRIDRALRRIDPQAVRIEMPTGVGFCMAMSRQALDRIGFIERETFGPGYGEENDWCRKAVAAGFHHLLLPDLYVLHAHGGSFPSEQKRKLIERNLGIVNRRYPDYAGAVSDFIQADLLAPLRGFLAFLLAVEKDRRPVPVIERGQGVEPGRPTIVIEPVPGQLAWSYEFIWPEGNLQLAGGNLGELTALARHLPLQSQEPPEVLSRLKESLLSF
jgi:GT2 family glycosyltransferase/MoaA/NifB/PqqE/SkfB family radical SAM enzyme